MCRELFKKLYIRKLWLEKGNTSFIITIRYTGLSTIVLFNVCCVLFLDACIVTGPVFMCGYVFTVSCSFVVCRHVSDRFRCAAGEKKVSEHWIRGRERRQNGPVQIRA